MDDMTIVEFRVDELRVKVPVEDGRPTLSLSLKDTDNGLMCQLNYADGGHSEWIKPATAYTR